MRLKPNAKCGESCGEKMGGLHAHKTKNKTSLKLEMVVPNFGTTISELQVVQCSIMLNYRNFVPIWHYDNATRVTPSSAIIFA